MQDEVRNILAGLIKKYGTSLIDEPKRLEALLRDLCGENKQEINALIGAAKLKIPNELLHPSSVPLETMSARLIKRLEDDLCFSESAACWAVESWAVALGIKLSADPPPLSPPPPQPPVEDGPVKSPVQPPVQPQVKPITGGKQRNANVFLIGALAVAVVCIVALLVIIGKPRRHDLVISPLSTLKPADTVSSAIGSTSSVLLKPSKGISIASLSLDLARVPGVASFPTGTDESGHCTTVNYPYYMAITEVTYGQWKLVYDWAMKHGYTFANPGSRGGYWDGKSLKVYKSGHADHPVTEVNWRDCIVWCNALTEYSKVVEGMNYSCVYRYNDSIVRDATNETTCNKVISDPGSKGYRLPTSMEWELAARYIDGSRWTPEDNSSGVVSPSLNDNATGAVAWYDANSNNSTHPVGQKKPNVLGIYDMSGNVSEWCFGWHPGDRDSYFMHRGGDWRTPARYMRINMLAYYNSSSLRDNLLGFRIVRTL